MPLRTERLHWLLCCCFLSLALHFSMARVGGPLAAARLQEPVKGIEVVLEPIQPPPPKPPAPKPPPVQRPKPAPAPPRPSPVAKAAPAHPRPAAPRPPAEAPAAAPMPSRAAPSVRIAARPAPERARPVALPAVTPAQEETLPSPLPRTVEAVTSGRSGPSLALANPLAQLAPAEEKASVDLPGSSSSASRVVRADAGGSPAQGPVPGGTGGYRAPRAEAEPVVFSNGGGSGSVKGTPVPPRAGGGGGASFLTVPNPLADLKLAEEKPGLGSGIGGGTGTGAGKGVGFSSGKGAGMAAAGPDLLRSLRPRPGTGQGTGKGSGTGSRSPGGGSGTGAEIPGTGGKGRGYGRGSGDGSGDGSGLKRLATRGGTGGGPGGSGTGLMRGIPFARIVGSLAGPTRGTGGAGTGGAGGPVHMVYVLDVSTSMREGNKIGKAKDALVKALGELKPGDTFNIIHFAYDVQGFSASPMAATPANLRQAFDYVERIPMRPGTNMSAGLQAGFSMPSVTHVFLLSDGEPTRGITDPYWLRVAVRDWNTRKARLITLALGFGEEFAGIPLLKGLAGDNQGQFSYVNLLNVPN